MKLWLDDIRRPPSEDWTWARTLEEAKLVVNSHEISEASLDHDLGLHEFDPDEENADVRRMPAQYRCYHCDALTYERGLNIAPDHCVGCGADAGALSKAKVPDGLEFAKWLVEVGKVPAVVRIHSMNPIGAMSMASALAGHCAVTIKPFER